MNTFTWYRAGDAFFPHASPWILDTISDSSKWVKPADLTPDGLGTSPVKETLSKWDRGDGALAALVPPEALSFSVTCHLYRGVSDQHGNVDVSGLCFIPGFSDPNNWPPGAYLAAFDTFGTAAVSGGSGQPHPPGTLVESLGNRVTVPNLVDGGEWASYYWQHRGNTPIGAGMILRLSSFTVPPGYVLPDPWPEQVSAPPPPGHYTTGILSVSAGSIRGPLSTLEDGTLHQAWDAGYVTISNPTYYRYDLPSPGTVSHAIMYGSSDLGLIWNPNPAALTLEYSDDGVNWTPTGSAVHQNVPSLVAQVDNDTQAGTHFHWRVKLEGQLNHYASEVRFFP